MNHKDIHIGSLIKTIVQLKGIEENRILKFFNLTNQEEIAAMYHAKSLQSDDILKWSKLLEYNFFIVYHTHLQLYAPLAATARINDKQKNDATKGLNFIKNIYTNEIKQFIIDLVRTNKLSINEVITQYNIPKTTLYKWLKKTPTTTL